MREKLCELDTQRLRFSAIFERYGIKNNFKGPPTKTLLFKDVRLNGELITNHLWFNETGGFKKLGELIAGDLIEFDARSKSYNKGYRGRDLDSYIENPPTTDWKLSYPTNICKTVSIAMTRLADVFS